MQATRLLIGASYACSRITSRLSLQQVKPAVTVCQRWVGVRHQSTDVLPSPHIEGTEKEYPLKLQNIVEEISQLTLLEVADLNDLLKKTLNIADAPVMMGAMPGAASAKEDEDEPAAKQEQIEFTVKLLKFDETKKVALIKELKKLMTGMNLVQAKKFVESCPQPVRTDIPKEEAETLKKAIEAAGGTVEIE